MNNETKIQTIDKSFINKLLIHKKTIRSFPMVFVVDFIKHLIVISCRYLPTWSAFDNLEP